MSFQPMARLAFGCHVMKPSMQATCNGLTSITITNMAFMKAISQHAQAGLKQPACFVTSNGNSTGIE